MSTAETSPTTLEQKYEIAHLKLVPKRHIGRTVAAGIVLLLLAALVRAFSVGQIEWSYVRDFLFAVYGSYLDSGVSRSSCMPGMGSPGRCPVRWD